MAPSVRAAFTGCVLALLLPFMAEARTTGVKAKHPKQHSKKAKVLVHQKAAGQVVAGRIDRLPRPFYGPFLPAEPYLYPQPLCQETDVVLEARFHEEGPASPEGRVEPEATALLGSKPAEAAAPANEAALARIARKVGSFFRPKSSSARIRPEDVDLSDLLSARFLIPVGGADVEKLRDSFLAARGRHGKHLAIDIGAPRGTPVVATSEGEVVKTPREKRGGRTIYMKDLSGHYLFYYAHLSKYAPGIAAGRKVKKGEVIGYVGSTGHVVGGPHLHFSIARVPGDKDTQREGLAINPYLLFLASVP
jgi:murein DD-endopeptidase MepM/ murein hydrolase activator NlpD